MAKLALYSYFQSSASYRVRIALNFKGLPYDYRAVDLVGNQQHEASYSRINPMREIPTLVTEGGVAIAQSMAIMFWLDRAHPDPQLFPGDADQMATIVQFCENINSGIHPIQNLKVRQELEKRFAASSEAREQWCAYWIERGFKSLEETLKVTSGKFCFGDVVTAADMFLIPQVFNARRYKVDMAGFSAISKIDKNCSSLEAFQKAQPKEQIDFK